MAPPPPKGRGIDASHLALIITTAFSIMCAVVTLYQYDHIRKLRTELSSKKRTKTEAETDTPPSAPREKKRLSAETKPTNPTPSKTKQEIPTPETSKPTNPKVTNQREEFTTLKEKTLTEKPTEMCPKDDVVPVANKESNNNNNKEPIAPLTKSDVSKSGEKTNTCISTSSSVMEVSAIGRVSSVYRLCVGTPRQGLLAPHARGRIELCWGGKDSLDCLKEYSHVWILFGFHLNTVSPSSSSSSSLSSSSTSKGKGRVKSKVSPPALGGTKVGIFATRTPHRPNPVGLSLCRLDRVDADKAIVHVSGLDLVDGTPVVDIKPYVPHYDSPCPSVLPENCTLPSWVSTGLETRRPVYHTWKAECALSILTKAGHLRFYDKDEYVEVRRCLDEVLGVDVRSAWQTDKVRQNKSQADRALHLLPIADDNLCSQQIDNLLVGFVVETTEDAHESGCNDTVIVKRIEPISSNQKEHQQQQNEQEHERETTKLERLRRDTEQPSPVYDEVWIVLAKSAVVDQTLRAQKQKEVEEACHQTTNDEFTKRLVSSPEKQPRRERHNSTDDTRDLISESDSHTLYSNATATTHGTSRKIPRSVVVKAPSVTGGPALPNPTASEKKNPFRRKVSPALARQMAMIQKMSSVPKKKVVASPLVDIYGSSGSSGGKDILEEPIVMDTEGYHKMKNYWAQTSERGAVGQRDSMSSTWSQVQGTGTGEKGEDGEASATS